MQFKKFFAITSCLSFIAVSGFSSNKLDEGMFPLSELSKLDLAKSGLLIPQKEIFNPDSISLIDALVNVGGCTGSFVSGQGLIITNHHCAFSAVQEASTKDKDYLKNGFVANAKEQEIEAKGLTARITQSYQDVSQEILAATTGIKDYNQRLNAIKNKIKEIEKRAENEDPGIKAEISEMFIGRTYVLFRYKIIKDVRLVYIPQQNIGEFGGETDNWVWPRHTGDFSFMRAYVAPDGSSATYSKDNVPYEPKKFIKINPEGIKENDFAFILGYPGKTFRHRPAQYISYQQQFLLPYVSELYGFQNAQMLKVGKEKGRNVELSLSTRIKRNANVMKNYQGKLKGLGNIDLLTQKRKEDENLAQYINGNKVLKAQYGNLMRDIEALYREINTNAYTDLWFEQIYRSTSLLRLAQKVNSFKRDIEVLPIDKRNSFYEKNVDSVKNDLDEIYKSYDYEVDRALFLNMLERATKLPSNQKLRFIESKLTGFNQLEDAERFINNVFSYTRIKDKNSLFSGVFRDANSLVSYNDALLDFEAELKTASDFNKNAVERRDATLNKLMADYVTVKEKYQNASFVPDANSTIRLTYGNILGYSPVDASYMKPFSSLKGIIEKGRSGLEDFEYNPKIKELWENGDFGNYKMDELNSVPVCFLYNMDTTGGNSGSPIFNAKGELIGVNFDRTYEATINDFAWSPDYSRSIGVDIRYVLWVAEKIDKANAVLEELGI
ncbi:dipeptidyl-peptidase 7 [Pseudopedobacter saltans DSM 12145]|uniref:Dipeptidyl-peptidase 7 n=1 Tax=Pseudopedobacter saltans (strain ATCC 51119 / DSM 12145 / JCM 21818 / CCUG 39354 / LMG 10337 / NBRC 100064 / NCIMB 13643) TaxID=762903 RepID=F0SAZ1_PSESL|nr:S46 family peptidase [Pseudopedobacter saltans]ADY51586.1 dipeptidyl-peptidase 7 [Pseudopedobacter saltans DSM 12145]